MGLDVAIIEGARFHKLVIFVDVLLGVYIVLLVVSSRVLRVVRLHSSGLIVCLLCRRLHIGGVDGAVAVGGHGIPIVVAVWLRFASAILPEILGRRVRLGEILSRGVLLDQRVAVDALDTLGDLSAVHLRPLAELGRVAGHGHESLLARH